MYRGRTQNENCYTRGLSCNGISLISDEGIAPEKRNFLQGAIAIQNTGDGMV